MEKVKIKRKLFFAIISMLILIPLINLNTSNFMNRESLTNNPFNIMVVKAAGGPAAPELTSPASGSNTNDNTPTLDWEDVLDSFFYQVQVDDFASFTSPVINTTEHFSTHTCSSLSDDTYYWRVRAQNEAFLWGSWSDTWNFAIDTVAPGIPTLSSPADGYRTNDDTPTFSWSSVATANLYGIQIDNNNDFSSPEVSTSTGSTSYTSTSLSHDVYYWRVRARDAVGNWGSFSGYRSIEVDLISDTPTQISPAHELTINDNTPTLSWSSIPDSISYELKVDDHPAFGSPIVATTTSSTSYTTSVLSDDLYYWIVRSFDGYQWSLYSGIWAFTVDTVPLDPPELLEPAEYTNDLTPTLEWTTISDATAYTVLVDDSVSFSSPVVNMTTIDPEYTCLTLTADTLYYWKVRAKDQPGNWGSYSAIGNFTIDVTPPSGIPTLISPADGAITSDSTPLLNWSEVPDGYIYRLQVAYDSDFTNLKTAVDRFVTHDDITFMTDGTTYYWRVRARDFAGNWGAWSDYFTITCDLSDPVITDVIYTPNTPDDNDVIAVYCNVTDNFEVSAVEFVYRIDGGSWVTLTMTNSFDNQYEVTLGTFNYDELIEFYIRAYDIASSPNQGINNNGGSYYSFTIASHDTTGPTISDVSMLPTTPTDGEQITIFCTATDASGISSVNLYYRVNGGSWIMVEMTLVGGSTYGVNIGPFDYANMIEYYLTAIDNSVVNNVRTDDNSGSYYQIIIQSSDVTAPEITDIEQDPVTPNDLQHITIICSVTDTSGVHSVVLCYRIDGSPWINVTMTLVTGSIYEVVIGTFSYGAEIEYLIVAYDDHASQNQAIDDNGGLFYSFTLTSGDIVGPNISSISTIPATPTDAVPVTIQVTVVDSNGVALVTLWYRSNNGSWSSIDMSLIGSNSYQATIGICDYNDFIEYYFVAVDASPNSNSVTDDNNGTNYSFTIASSDVTGPIISGISHTPENPTADQNITITCTVLDTSGIQSVILYYRIDGGTWISIAMIETATNTYSVTLGSFLTGEFVQYYVVATDDSVIQNSTTDNNEGEFYFFKVLERSVTSSIEFGIILGLVTISFVGLVILRSKRKITY